MLKYGNNNFYLVFVLKKKFTYMKLNFTLGCFCVETVSYTYVD